LGSGRTDIASSNSGFRYTLREVDKDQVEETLIAANADQDIDGIIVYYPIFGNRQDQYLQQIVDVSKDVEGLSHRYIFNMYQNIRFLDDAQAQKSILPCTPLAVIKVLEYLRIYNTILPYGNRLFGHTICVVNRSEVVGRPLAALLANDGACVYSVDVTGIQKFTRGEGIRKRKHELEDMKEWGLEDCLPFCDVVVTGVPGEKYKFPCHLLREGAVCVNFSSDKVRWPEIACNIERCWEDLRLTLLQNFGSEVKEKASIYVPGIGKVTIVVLLRNLLRIVENRRVDERKAVEPAGKPGIVGAPSH
jgi:methylenetetrahydrofolate dehydrogenase (NAD+)